MKKSQLNAISYSYREKKSKELKKLLEECKKNNIEIKKYQQLQRQINECKKKLEEFKNEKKSNEE